MYINEGTYTLYLHKVVPFKVAKGIQYKDDLMIL